MSDKKNLCMLPWVHLHTWPNGNVYPCCITPMQYIAGNLNDDSLEDIYNSDLMKDIRVKMLNDERHEACARCYHQEDSGGHSMRHRANKSWKKHEKRFLEMGSFRNSCLISLVALSPAVSAAHRFYARETIHLFYFSWNL